MSPAQVLQRYRGSREGLRDTILDLMLPLGATLHRLRERFDGEVSTIRKAPYTREELSQGRWRGRVR